MFPECSFIHFGIQVIHRRGAADAEKYRFILVVESKWGLLV